MSSPSSGQAGSAEGQANVVAFVSSVAGTGCTSTVANLACVLAGAGRRLLIIDWGSDVPQVRAYLEPFYAGQVELSAVPAGILIARHAGQQTPWEDQQLSVARFALPEANGHIDVIDAADGNSARYPVAGDDPIAVAELRKQLPNAGYDHVLIDAPTGGMDTSLELIATLCELAVVCFRPQPRAIQEAAHLATRLRRQAPIGIDLVPVAMAFDDRYPPRTEQIRTVIRAAFADLPADQPPGPAGHGAIEIPYRSFDTFDPLLTVLVEEPSPIGTLQTGYERLASAVTGGSVAELVPVSPEFRSRYRRVFGLASSGEPDPILVAYAPTDRPWADWVRARLERSGARTESLAVGRSSLDPAQPPGLVVISSAVFDESAELATVTETIAAAKAAGTQLNVFRVVVDGRGVAPSEATSATVAPGSEPALAARLLNHFGLIDRPSTEVDHSMRQPGDLPAIFDVPHRHPHFVGRDEDIEKLRDQFAERSERRSILTLSGVPGVGKSELALEYAHRFASDYDLVWWVPSVDEQSILVSLAHLANRLEVAGTPSSSTTAALSQLAIDQNYRRFLLVYDNVADHTGLQELLPSEHRGHVIITSSEAHSAEIELGPMAPRDCVALLAKRVYGISPQDAALVATAAHHLPMAVELAGSWLAVTAAGERSDGASVDAAAAWAVRAFLDRLDDGDCDTISWQENSWQENSWQENSWQENSWQEGVSRVAVVVTKTLRETSTGQVAVALAQLCSFLSQDGISLDLVRSTAMFHQLIAVCGARADQLLLDAWEIDRALWMGVRYGLFRVDWGKQNLLRVHRIVQTALREAMPPRERDERQACVLTALAAYAPTEVEDNAPYNAARFAELQKHVFPSGAVDSDDNAVRRWLVNQVRFLYSRGGSGVHRTALGPTQKLLDDWTSRYGPDDLMRMRLAGQLANLYRALGDHQQALRLDEGALAGQRRSLSLNHPQVLISARGRGGDLRGLGLFADALEEDRTTWEGLREAFGEDHPQTRMAANNLASSLYLSGDVRGALDVAEGNFHRRMRLLGEHDPSTWTSRAQVGVYRRELGDYQKAHTMLTEAGQRLRQQNSQLELAVRWHQAIALRCQGKSSLAKKRTSQALRDYLQLSGQDHPNTLACMLSFAAAHRAVGADKGRTIELAETALDGFRTKVRLPEQHPFLALCQVGVGLARSAAGQDGASHTCGGLDLLRDQLGELHPWTLAAAIDHARVLAARGDADAATELITAAHRDCIEFLGTEHPHTEIAEHNLHLAHEAAELVGQDWREIDVDIPES